jgi:hypothetical protein
MIICTVYKKFYIKLFCLFIFILSIFWLIFASPFMVLGCSDYYWENLYYAVNYNYSDSNVNIWMDRFGSKPFYVNYNSNATYYNGTSAFISYTELYSSYSGLGPSCHESWHEDYYPTYPSGGLYGTAKLQDEFRANQRGVYCNTHGGNNSNTYFNYYGSLSKLDQYRQINTYYEIGLTDAQVCAWSASH